MKDTKVQWHLEFINEHDLDIKPLEIDLLVIKKDKGASIENEIGAIFRGHNIVDYKSPEDNLNIDTFYRVGSYAGLYKSNGKTVDEIKADDITVSLIREARPDGLLQYFKGHGYPVMNPYRGIYYVEGKVLFPTQIIVTGELEQGTHIWLKALSGQLGKDD